MRLIMNQANAAQEKAALRKYIDELINERRLPARPIEFGDPAVNRVVYGLANVVSCGNWHLLPTSLEAARRNVPAFAAAIAGLQLVMPPIPPTTGDTPKGAYTPQEYIDTLYHTGFLPLPELRPLFDQNLDRHVQVIERMQGGGASREVMQARILSDPVLHDLLPAVSEYDDDEPGDDVLRDDESGRDDEPDNGVLTQQVDEARFIVKDGKLLLRFCSIMDIYALPDPDYLIANILECNSVSLLYGTSGTGKSFTALDIALCIAHGLPWMGHSVKPGLVWYINTEGGNAFGKRIRAWYREHEIEEPTSNLEIILWSLDPREYSQTVIDTITTRTEKGGPGPEMIIFDNFSMCTPGVDQTKQELVTPVLLRLSELAQEYKCHIMIIHHTNKGGDFNGSMAFRNHVDTMIELKKEDSTLKESPILLCCRKARDDEPFDDVRMELKQIVVDVDEETNVSTTSCAIVPSDSAPIKQHRLEDTTQNILDILGDRSLHYSDWEGECIETLHMAPKTFDRHRKLLINRHCVEKYKPAGEKVDRYRKATKNRNRLEVEEEDVDAMQGIDDDEDGD